MRLVTLSDLKTAAKYYSDMQNSSFITEDEWNFYINQAATDYYNMINGLVEDYNIVEYDFIIPAQSVIMPLPDDFFDIRGLDVNINVNATPQDLQWRTVKKYEFLERNKNNLYSMYYFGNFIEYRIQGNNINFIPATHSTLKARLFYTPVLPRLVIDTDTVDGVNGFDDYIAICAAIRAKEKEETDSSSLLEKRTRAEAMLKSYASSRNNDQGKCVADINRIGFWGY